MKNRITPISPQAFSLIILVSIICCDLRPFPSFGEPVVTYTAGVMTKSYDERRTKALEKFEEIIGKYIEERAGIRIKLKAMTYPDLVKTLEKGNVDFVWGYGLIVSMELSQKFSLLPMVSPTLGEEKRSLYRRLAATSKEVAQGIGDLMGLKGKRFTYVGDEQWSFEMLAFKVWVAEKFGIRDISQTFVLKGRDPDEGFFIPASKRGAIYSLFVKEADMAVAHEFEYITQEKLTPNALRERVEILPLTHPPEEFMEAPLYVRKSLNKKDVDKLIKLLIDMPNDPEGKQILLSSKISGFTKVADQDYRTVRALMAKREGLGIK